MHRGETKSGAVISDDMILKWKLIWSQVAAGLRSPFRQKGPREIAEKQPPAIAFSYTPLGANLAPGFLNKCRDPRIDELSSPTTLNPDTYSAPFVRDREVKALLVVPFANQVSLSSARSKFIE